MQTVPIISNTSSTTTKVVVATTVALTFITFWEAASVVLNVQGFATGALVTVQQTASQTTTPDSTIMCRTPSVS